MIEDARTVCWNPQRVPTPIDPSVHFFSFFNDNEGA